MDNVIFEDNYRVTFVDCNAKGVIKASAIMDVLQEVAGAHSGAIGYSWEKLHDLGFVFLLSRIGFEMHQYPGNGDIIKILTWTTEARGFVGERHYQLRNASNELVCEAQTTWILFDLKKGRPARPGNLLEEFPVRKDYSSPINAVKLEAVSNPSSFTDWSVRYSDLDMNQHVNNSRYLHWLLDTYDMDHHTGHVLSEVQGNFLNEVHYGDPLQFYKDSKGNSDLISGRSGDKELFRFRLNWRAH
ncbi:acyl-[acyl-carrier-protein] thioesterase [Spirochaeta cellobiosiphila]|uniref:acyl-[acyl-carrier-protein] thioesterase n=1 Tax=Spirochaeta cellobiosiphila TaxID=504483 RepID=UPI00041DB00D|nr:acyl-ACP thioesterase domain-containing protein [Spirochaeta cellobiosiphila]